MTHGLSRIDLPFWDLIWFGVDRLGRLALHGRTAVVHLEDEHDGLVRVVNYFCEDGWIDDAEPLMKIIMESMNDAMVAGMNTPHLHTLKRVLLEEVSGVAL